jgi:hypothetical protein
VRRVDKDTVLASLDAQGIISRCAAELAALCEYELWRAEFSSGSATLDGQHIEQLSREVYAKRTTKRRRKLRSLR